MVKAVSRSPTALCPFPCVARASLLFDLFRQRAKGDLLRFLPASVDAIGEETPCSSPLVPTGVSEGEGGLGRAGIAGTFSPLAVLPTNLAIE